jgi:hypothetical protein
MKIEELVGSLLTYELSLPPIKKAKSNALKASKVKEKILLKKNLMMMMVYLYLLGISEIY